MRTTFPRAALLLGLAVILLGMPLLLAPHRLRPTTFRLIKVGMTEAEVEDLLGVPPGNYDGFGAGFLDGGWNSWSFHSQVGSLTWCSRHGTVRVWFDEQRRVRHTSAGRSQPATWWGRLYQRFLPARQAPAIEIY